MFGLVTRPFMRALGLLPRRPVGIALVAIGLAVIGILRLMDGGPWMLLGVLQLIAAFGLWRMRVWSWWLGLLAGLIGLYIAWGNTLWLVVWAAFLLYLVLVRDAFHPFWQRVKRAVA